MVFKMIDINVLDKNKTYVGFSIGDSFISRLIQNFSKKETRIRQDKIATHIFAIVFENGKPVVYESHLNQNGCKKIPYLDWVKDYKTENIFAFPYELNRDALLYYTNFNPGYSFAEIGGLALEEITEKHFWNNNPGVTCSEYIASCTQDFDICYRYNLPTFRVKPVHWQNLLSQKGK